MLKWTQGKLGAWALLSNSGRRGARVAVDGFSRNGEHHLRCRFRLEDLPDLNSTTPDAATISNVAISLESLLAFRNNLDRWLTDGTSFMCTLSASGDCSCSINLGEHHQLLTNARQPAIAINITRATYATSIAFTTDETCVRKSISELDQTLGNVISNTQWSVAWPASRSHKEVGLSGANDTQERYSVLLVSLQALSFRELARIRAALDADVSLNDLRGVEEQDLPLMMVKSRTLKEVEAAIAALGELQRHVRVVNAALHDPSGSSQD